MEFKVGVSFLTPQAEQSQARQHTKSVSDFGAKLGLQSDSSAVPNRETAAFEERSLQLSTNQSSKAVQLASEQSGVGASTLTELYALGLRAGHHLSHVPHAFMADTLSTGSMISIEDEAGAILGSMPRALADAAIPLSVAVQSASIGTSQSSLLSLEGEAPSSMRELMGYLSSQWPERRWQLMKRPDGLELLVRDYHLSHEEQEQLVAELRARSSASTQPLDRIWLNGQVVWQAQAALNHAMTGGHYGR